MRLRDARGLDDMELGRCDWLGGPLLFFGINVMKILARRCCQRRRGLIRSFLSLGFCISASLTLLSRTTHAAF
jgi:hypothetical protein